MAIDQQDFIQAVEIMKMAKPIFENNDGYITAIVGAGGAIGGALATFFPVYWLARINEKKLERSTASQLYSEIKATLVISQSRGYISDLQKIVDSFEWDKTFCRRFYVQVPDDRFPIFRANISNLGRLEPKLQGQVVLLYQLLEAIIQDIKPGGILSEDAVTKEAFSETLELCRIAKSLAENVLAKIEATYPDVV